MLLAAMLALAALMAAAAPAMADDFDHHHFFDHVNRFDGLFFNRFFEPTPALEFNQEAENTGNVTISTAVSQTGNNSNQCVAPLQFGNTGNVQNAQGFVQSGTPFFNNNEGRNGFFRDGVFFPEGRDRFFRDGFLFPNDGFVSNVGDVEFEGSSMTFTPTLTNTCNQSVEQAAAA